MLLEEVEEEEEEEEESSSWGELVMRIRVEHCREDAELH